MANWKKSCTALMSGLIATGPPSRRWQNSIMFFRTVGKDQSDYSATLRKQLMWFIGLSKANSAPRLDLFFTDIKRLKGSYRVVSLL